MNNKRGDIPIIILVIGVVALCIFAILSFQFSPRGQIIFAVEPYLIEDVISLSEQISFYEKQGIDFSNLIEMKETDLGNDLYLKEAGSDIYIRKNDDGSYSVREEFRNPKGLVFSVEHTFVPYKQ